MNLFVFGCCLDKVILSHFVFFPDWLETNHKLKLARNQSQNVPMADRENDLLSTLQNGA